MLSIISITLAFIIGIAWGLYLEFYILVLALIFLLFMLLMLVFFDQKFLSISKYFIDFTILCIIFLVGYFYSLHKISDFDSKYKEDEIKQEVTITSHYVETDYYYKYYCKSRENDKFLLLFKKSDEACFNIGTKLNIMGDFELPDIARNTGGFNYRRYLNSNNVYGTIKVSSYIKINIQSKNISFFFQNIIFNLQNIIRENFLKLFPKNYAGILNGMLIGETNDISDDVLKYFKDSRNYSFTCCFGFKCCLGYSYIKIIIFENSRQKVFLFF